MPSNITHIINKVDNEHSITCLCCGLTSYNKSDVVYLYCAFCDMSHNDHDKIKNEIILKNKEKICKLKQYQQKHS